jgi:hypothetical protein
MYVHPQDAFGVIKFTPVYTSIRHEPKKDQITGEAVEMVREFIFENLTAPTHREMMKSKEYQGVYEHQGLGKQNNQ